MGGLVSIQNSAVLASNLPSTVNFPANHFAPGGSATNGSCRTVSYPLLANNAFWQNSAYYIGVGALSAQYQQNIVSLYNAFTTTLAPNQPQAGATTAHGAGFTITGGTGACMPATYWDIGVRGDTGPGAHTNAGAIQLAPINSILTNASENGLGSNNLPGSNPNFASQYCDGARTPPELAASGFAVPPGISDATVPNPIFNLTPVATVDEGNNWINLCWGPLSLLNPVSGATLGNYSITAGSPAIDKANDTFSPSTDFFGTHRPQGSEPDIGAVEFIEGNAADMDVSPQSIAFGSVTINTTSPSQFVTVTNTGSATLTGISTTFTGSAAFTRGSGTQNCGTTLAVGATCRIYVTFHPTAAGTVNATMTINSNDTSPDAAADKVVSLSGTGVKLTVTPGSLAFVSIGGGFSAAQTVTLGNVGPGAIGLNAPTITNVINGVTFNILSNNCPASLNPGANCQIRVRFSAPTPFTVGTGSLNVSDNEPATVTVGLTGIRLF